MRNSKDDEVRKPHELGEALRREEPYRCTGPPRSHAVEARNPVGDAYFIEAGDLAGCDLKTERPLGTAVVGRFGFSVSRFCWERPLARSALLY